MMRAKNAPRLSRPNRSFSPRQGRESLSDRSTSPALSLLANGPKSMTIKHDRARPVAPSVDLCPAHPSSPAPVPAIASATAAAVAPGLLGRAPTALESHWQCVVG